MTSPTPTQHRVHLSHLSAHVSAAVGAFTRTPVYEEEPVDNYPQWSDFELDHFFRSLRSRSRLRPDLITADLQACAVSYSRPAKTLAEVCVLLSSLERAAASLRDRERLHGIEDGAKFDREPAYEVSEEWIRFEERIAVALNTPDEQALKRIWLAVESPLDIPSIHVILPKDMIQDVEHFSLSQAERKIESNPSDPEDHSEAPTAADPRLSPMSRRTVMKRLYMRRKRALGTGAGIGNGLQRLKRGRKKKIFTQAERLARGAKNDETQLDEHSDSGFMPSHKAGASLPRLAPRQLGRDGLDLFNLSNFRAAMKRLSHKMNDTTVVADLPSVSYNLLRILRLRITYFVSRLLFCAVSIAEHDKRVKGHTKVWGDRLANIQSSHVRLALESMGVGKAKHVGLPTKRFKCQQAGRKLDDAIVEEEKDSTQESAGSEETTPPKSRMTTPTYPASVHLPFSAYLPSISMPTGRDPFIFAVQSDDTDEEMDDVLQEDAELDHRDLADARMYEDALWKEFGTKPANGGADEEAPKRSRRTQRRSSIGTTIVDDLDEILAQYNGIDVGRASQPFKSREFIDDSDEGG